MTDHEQEKAEEKTEAAGSDQVVEIEEGKNQQAQPGQQQSADLLPPGCGMWFAWVFTSTVGAAVGWILGWQVSFIIPGIFSTIMLGAVTGLVIGSLQWLVLRAQFNRSALWILATSAGWAIGFSLGVFTAQSFELIDWSFGLAAGIVTGAVVGVSQWLYLSRRVPRALLWIPLSTFALASGFIYYRAEAVWIGLLFGALYGIVTGVGLVWFLFGPVKE
jgi:hypothetical protein